MITSRLSRALYSSSLSVSSWASIHGTSPKRLTMLKYRYARKNRVTAVYFTTASLSSHLSMYSSRVFIFRRSPQAPEPLPQPPPEFGTVRLVPPRRTAERFRYT